MTLRRLLAALGRRLQREAVQALPLSSPLLRHMEHAARAHGGQWRLLSVGPAWTCAFGTPLVSWEGQQALASMPLFATPDAAMRHALASGHTFADYVPLRLVTVRRSGAKGVTPIDPQDCPHFLTYGTPLACCSDTGNAFCRGYQRVEGDRALCCYALPR